VLSCLAVFIAITALLKYDEKKADSTAPPQNAIFQILMEWADESASDIDLWGEDPNNNIVGFKRREGGDTCLMSLARDDIGTAGDFLADGNNIKKNNEVISIRGIVAGEYIFNAHYYAKKDTKEAIRVKAKVVRVKPYELITEKELIFFDEGDEQTFFRLSLDKDGKVNGINSLPKIIAKELK
jgi:hypothetical protein